MRADGIPGGSAVSLRLLVLNIQGFEQSDVAKEPGERGTPTSIFDGMDCYNCGCIAAGPA